MFGIVDPSLLTLPPPPSRKVRTMGTGMTGPVGATGPTGPVGMGLNGPAGPPGSFGPAGVTQSKPQSSFASALGPPGPKGPVGMTGCVMPVGAVGATGATGAMPTGPVGMTGPSGPLGPVVLKTSEFRLEARYSGPPREVLAAVLRGLSHLGHSWQVTGPSAVCDHCLSSVHVDPLRKSQSQFRRGPKARLVPSGEVGIPPRLVWSRKLCKDRLPKASDLRRVAASYPTCAKARQRLVDHVHDM